MRKKTALEYFGGPSKLAKALDVTVSAVSQWDDPLPRHAADRIIGWFARQGKLIPAEMLAELPKEQA